MELPHLLLTPRSLEFLGQFILASLLFIYLVHGLRSSRQLLRGAGTRYLTAALAVYITNLVLLFLYFSLLAVERLPALVVSEVITTLFLFLLIKFVYRTPDLPPEWNKEEKIASWASAGVVAIGIGITAFRLIALLHGQVREQSIGLNLLSTLVIMWLIVVLARQTIRMANVAEPNAHRIAQLFFVQAKDARAARSFLLLATLMLIMSILKTFHTPLTIPANALGYLASFISTIILIAMMLVAVNYYLPNVSFVVQITSIIAVIITMLSSTTGISVISAFAQTRQNTLIEITPKRILFTPSESWSYRVEMLPLASIDAAFESLAGECTLLPARQLAASETEGVALPFTFRFYGQPWTDVYLHPQGFLTFGAPQKLVNLEYRYGDTPSIFALHRSGLGSTLSTFEQYESFAVASRTTERSAEFFWCPPTNADSAIMPAGIFPENTLPQNTVRVVLNADHSFAIDHINVAPVPFHPALLTLNYWRWWVGANDGNTMRLPHHIDWMEMAPKPISTDRALIDNYQATLRGDTHFFILQLSLLVVFGIFTATGAIPLFLRIGFMRPVENLLNAILRTQSGDLTVQITAHQDNEIGIISRAFNQSVLAQRSLLETLETQVAKRTQMLTVANRELQQAIDQHRKTQAALTQLNLHLEDKVNERVQALAASEERFRRVVTSIQDAVYAVTFQLDPLEFTVDYASPKLRSFGIHVEEGGTHNLEQWLATYVAPDDHKLAWQHIAEIIDRRSSWTEGRIIQADGAYRWVRNNVRSEPIEPMKIRCYGVMSDISARKQLEQETAQREALQEIDRMRSEWLANLSHELRTPLGIIKTAATTLLADDVVIPPAMQRFVLRQLNAETDRLKLLFDTLLDLSRLETAALKLDYEEINIAEMLQMLITDVRNQMSLGALPPFTVELETSSPNLPVVVDAQRLKLVFQNLLSNAMKFSPDHSTITIRARCEGNTTFVEVEDQGIGIDEAESEYIFNRYYQIRHPGQRSHNGVGLGLPICREIVTAHGGAISLTSRRAATQRADEQQQSGTTFIVQFPCRPPSAAGVAQDLVT